MLRSHLKIALRHLARHKVYAFVNAAGLAVGIACFLLIALYVRHELSYDAYHEHAERVFRVTREWVDDEHIDEEAYAGFTDATLDIEFATAEELNAEYRPVERGRI